MLGEITPEQLPMFLIGNPELLPAAYSKKIQKSLLNLASYFTLGILLGGVANVQIKRVSMNFLKWPFYARFPVRLAVFAIPFGFLYPKINSNLETVSGSLNTIYMKIRRLHKTGNIE
jgi:hypothetical protein